MALELITKDEFIKKYIPKETKEKDQAFYRKRKDCLDMGFNDVFIKPYGNQIFIHEARYQDFLMAKYQQRFDDAVKAAKSAARF